MLPLHIYRILVPLTETGGASIGTYEVPDENTWHVHDMVTRVLNETMFEVIVTYVDHVDCVKRQLDQTTL
jgi:hypothetical protein